MAATAAARSKPTTIANHRPTINNTGSCIQSCSRRRRKLPTNPAKLLLDRRQHPRPTSPISAELVLAGTGASTRTNHQPYRPPLSAPCIPSVVTGSKLSSYLAPTNATECCQSLPTGRRYASEPVDFRHGEYGSDDVAGPAATADSMSTGCFAAATNACTVDCSAELFAAATATSSDRVSVNGFSGAASAIPEPADASKQLFPATASPDHVHADVTNTAGSATNTVS